MIAIWRMTRSFLANVVGREVLEALGAVAGLEQECVAGRNAAEFGLQRACFAGKHERRERCDLLQRRFECGWVGPCRLLLDGCVLATTTVSTFPEIPSGRLPTSSPQTRVVCRCRLNRSACENERSGRISPAASLSCSDLRCSVASARRDGQTARMRSASSRRPATARLTRRRAASAVTPSCSPTSRKLLRSPSTRPKRASTAKRARASSVCEQFVEQFAVDESHH